MKYVLMLIGAFGMFIVGYLSEPALRGMITRDPDKAEPAAPAADAAKQSIEAAAEVPPSTPDSIEVVDEESELVDGEPTETNEAAEATEVEITAAPSTEGGAIHQIMQRSLLDSEVSHFSVAQVIEFKEVGQTEVDGVQYDFGMVDYRENTIFGERVYQAKALIRDGKVEKWIWPSNGMKIP